jgi:hypothetical protein
VTRRVWIAVAAALVVAVGVVAFVAERGTGAGGTPRQQMAAWVSSTGLGQDLGTLHQDGLDVERVLAGHKGTVTLALHTACNVLSTTAELAHSNLPSPDTEVTQLLARAYTLEYEAGIDCYDAGATGTALLRRSAAERSQAQRIIGRALARVGSLTGRTVPTTTTTQPTTGTGIFG